MLAEVQRLLDIKPGETIVDGTIGPGGHAEAMGRALGTDGMLLGLDRDVLMAARARERLAASCECEVRVVAANFSQLADHLEAAGRSSADAVLLDLGVASPQIDDPARGFSYRSAGPLDMRMNGSQGLSAADWINQVTEKELADVLYELGDECFSRRIARAIVRARSTSPIRGTAELAETIRRAVPRRPRRLHPARRSFQAIRIFVNREMEHLERFLEYLPRLLNPGGRCAIISYHSLEDRRVKNAFRDGVKSGVYEALTKKPLRPALKETRTNPRSRSARLRAVRRTMKGIAT